MSYYDDEFDEDPPLEDEEPARCCECDAELCYECTLCHCCNCDDLQDQWCEGDARYVEIHPDLKVSEGL